MHIHAARRWTAAAVVVLLPVALSGAQQDYAIKLHRPAVVGTKYVVVASAGEDETMTTSVDGQSGPADTTSISVELTAHVTTLTIAPNGKESKITLVIDKSKCAASGITSEVLPAGTTVVGVRDGDESVYSVNDTMVNPRATKCLKLALPVGGSDSSNDDRVFGTTARQKVGSSWPLNSALVAQELLKASGLMVEPRNVTGSVRLAEVGSFADQPALHIVGEVKMINVVVPVPPGIAVKSSEFTAALSGLFPVDPSRAGGQSSTTMTGRVECEGDANGRRVRLLMTMNQRDERTITVEVPSETPRRTTPR